MDPSLLSAKEAIDFRNISIWGGNCGTQLFLFLPSMLILSYMPQTFLHVIEEMYDIYFDTISMLAAIFISYIISPINNMHIIVWN